MNKLTPSRSDGLASSSITAVIRYSNNRDTLPKVLEGLLNQDHPVDHILAVNNGSNDGSTQLLQEYGAEIINWDGTYHHARVLNWALKSTNNTGTRHQFTHGDDRFNYVNKIHLCFKKL